MTTLKKHFVLIDYENLRPLGIHRLSTPQVAVKVFKGRSQKVPVETLNEAQSLGKNLEYIEISGTGKNALDFHIAFYIGKLSCEDSTAEFHIISKDTGFDPLIQHLKEKGTTVRRHATLDTVLPLLNTHRPEAKAPIDAAPSEVVVNALCEKLINSNAPKPGTLQKLKNALKHLDSEASAIQIEQAANRLSKMGFGTRKQKSLKPVPSSIHRPKTAVVAPT